jgi:hypothetical protein
MPPIFRALCWALALICVALAQILDIIPQNVASMLIVVLPAIMIATTPRDGRACGKTKAA